MLIKDWEYWEYNLSIGQMALSPFRKRCISIVVMENSLLECNTFGPPFSTAW